MIILFRKREEAKALIKAAGCDLRETLLDSPEETMEMEVIKSDSENSEMYS